uniref:Uncharacterized protein n=1 Tax=Anguilla anguilla TaxID=7936 RepID=A0A0E9VRQ2_ANGAN
MPALHCTSSQLGIHWRKI